MHLFLVNIPQQPDPYNPMDEPLKFSNGGKSLAKGNVDTESQSQGGSRVITQTKEIVSQVVSSGT